MEFKVDTKISEDITVCKTNLTINKYAVVFGELDKPVFVALRKSKISAIKVAEKALKKNNGLNTVVFYCRCYFFAMHSTSTKTFLGSLETSTQLLAGKGATK